MQHKKTTFGRWASRLALTLATAGLLTACGGGSDAGDGDPTGNADAATRTRIESVVREAMAAHHMRASIVRITVDGQNVYTGAMGESTPGVPATPDMHFRAGSFGFTLMGQIFAKLADQPVPRISLDDKLAKWMPALPRADQVSLRNLLNMTSGYPDYVYQPVTLDILYNDPYHRFTTDQLIEIGVSEPELFEPGTNWHYSHTNYAILGKVLERITGKPLDAVMQEYALGPMGLKATSGNNGTPAIPEPVLHSFSSERREVLKIPDGTPFMEDATFWDPSWTTASGAVLTSNIHDISRTMEIVGSGAQVSREMYQQQVGLNLVDFGEKTDRCRDCRHLTAEFSYGLGVTLRGPWLAQTKNFAGSGVSSLYLPSKRLAISVATTYLAGAYKDNGDFLEASNAMLKSLAEVMALGNGP